jgi:predicted lipid-binding transport protein (Tim44 family)
LLPDTQEPTPPSPTTARRKQPRSAFGFSVVSLLAGLLLRGSGGGLEIAAWLLMGLGVLVALACLALLVYGIVAEDGFEVGPEGNKRILRIRRRE